MLAVAAATCLVVGAHVRQQGLFLLPVLILCPWFVLVRNRRPAAWIPLAWVAASCALFLALGAWTNTRITHQEGHDRERGIRLMLTFDILGTAAMDGQPIPGTQATQGEIRRAYSPARIDTLSSVPALGSHFRKMSTADLRDLWLHTVSSHPSAFIRHRLSVAARVLNLQDLDQCLPLHVGVDGNASVLARVGLQPGADKRDQWMYALSLPLRWTPWFRHYATLAGNCILAFCAWRRRRSPAARVVFWFAVCMTGYALFSATLAIACDFRYLYPAITVGSAGALGLLTHRGHARSGDVLE
ncbi:MAG: hypothetical protein ABIQ62_05050 [Thermomonas sp.]